MLWHFCALGDMVHFVTGLQLRKSPSLCSLDPWICGCRLDIGIVAGEVSWLPRLVVDL